MDKAVSALQEYDKQKEFKLGDRVRVQSNASHYKSDAYLVTGICTSYGAPGWYKVTREKQPNRTIERHAAHLEYYDHD